MAGFVEFFYNIIPGSLLISSVYFTAQIDNSFGIEKIPLENELLIVTILTIFALFLGFFFQEIGNYLFKKRLRAEDAKSKAEDEIESENFNRAVGNFQKNFSWDQEKPEDAFNYMHNYIFAKGYNKLPEHFNARASLWANTTIAGVIYAFITFCMLVLNQDNFFIYISLILLSFIITCKSYLIMKTNISAFNDIILKTYIGTTITHR